MKHLLCTVAILLVCILGLAAGAAAQTPVTLPGSYQLAWTHDGVQTDGYKLRIDDAAPVVVQAVCAVDATNVRTCSIPFPALTPGAHTLYVIAFNAGAEASSDPFPVAVTVKPAPPTGMKIIQKAPAGEN